MKKNISMLILSLMAMGSCKMSQQEILENNTHIDEEFTELYMKNSDGITGADGTISFTLKDGSSIFMTGDCFLGKIIDESRSYDAKMINNAFIHIGKDYNYISSYFDGNSENPNSLYVPLEAKNSSTNFWYWPGHGFQHGDIIHLFMTKFYQGGDGMWGFVFGGTDYLRVSSSDYSLISVEEIYNKNTLEHWGHSIMKDNEYYYIYGTRPNENSISELCISRAMYDEEKKRLGDFSYFDGKSWSSSCEDSKSSEGIDISVSEQFSVFKYNDKYVLLTQEKGQQIGEIYSFISENPYGPWENKKLLYVTTEQIDDNTLFTYNAMAHPQFINEKEELLICYNVNSYEIESIFSDVKKYRPVFLRVPMRNILQ